MSGVAGVRRKGSTMRSLITTFICCALLSLPSYAAEKGVAYVDGTKSFLEISDPNRQAEAWAICAASYDFMADLFSEAQPARAQQLRELANGAEVAAIMSIFVDGLTPDITPERYSSLWAAAKLQGTELPKTSRTFLAAEAESTPKNETNLFLSNMAATVKICVSNLPGQQAHIDTYREFTKSGLLTLPKE